MSDVHYDSDADEYILSSGRRFYAHQGVVGLSLDRMADCEVSHGFDGGVDVQDWTPAERVELANFMIALWTVFREAQHP